MQRQAAKWRKWRWDQNVKTKESRDQRGASVLQPNHSNSVLESSHVICSRSTLSSFANACNLKPWEVFGCRHGCSATCSYCNLIFFFFLSSSLLVTFCLFPLCLHLFLLRTSPCKVGLCIWTSIRILCLTPDNVDWLPTERQAKHYLSCIHRIFSSLKHDEQPK